MTRTNTFLLVYTAANTCLILYGILILGRPGILLDPFMLRVYQFPEDATTAQAYLAALYRLLGFFNLFAGVLGILLLHRFWVSREMWPLRIVIISTIFAYIGPIVFDNTVGSVGFFEIVELVLFGLAVILGIAMWWDWNYRKWLLPSYSIAIIVKRLSNMAQIGVNDKVNHLGATPPGIWVIKHLISPLQRWIYRGSRGRFFSSAGSGRKVLLLTTKGRRTGKDRTTPVFYLRNEESIVICNVNPGFEHTNPWVVNLRANPVAQLQIGDKIGLYKAHEATDTEVELYWPRLVALWPAYQTHFERSGHRAIFILEKTGKPIF